MESDSVGEGRNKEDSDAVELDNGGHSHIPADQTLDAEGDEGERVLYESHSDFDATPGDNNVLSTEITSPANIDTNRNLAASRPALYSRSSCSSLSESSNSESDEEPPCRRYDHTGTRPPENCETATSTSSPYIILAVASLATMSAVVLRRR
jgi:hypothetical protein